MPIHLRRSTHYAPYFVTRVGVVFALPGEVRRRSVRGAFRGLVRIA